MKRTTIRTGGSTAASGAAGTAASPADASASATGASGVRLARPASERTDLVVGLSALTSALVGVRAQMHALQALEATLLTAGNQIAHLMANAEGARDHGEFAHRAVAAELGLAVRETDRAMAFKIGRAVTLVTEYPAVHAALAAGSISQGHAIAITEAGAIINTDGRAPEARTHYAEAALAIAEQEVVGRARPLVKELAEQYANRSLDERHAEAKEGRLVSVRELDDGMAELTAVLSESYAFGIQDRLTQMAKRVKNAEVTCLRERKSACHGRDGSGDGDGDGDGVRAGGGNVDDGERSSPIAVRSMDQIRADLLTDMLLAGDPNKLATSAENGLKAITARVQVVVPKARVVPGVEVSTQSVAPPPATLASYGPIDDDTVKRLAGNARHWEEATVDTAGNILKVDTYRPSKKLRRYLGARDLHCRYPGCRVPLDPCDIDHTIDAALGGETSNINLAHLCRWHHTLKHHSAWNVAQGPDGTLHWTSPAGRNYREVSPSRVKFRAYLDAAPEQNGVRVGALDSGADPDCGVNQERRLDRKRGRDPDRRPRVSKAGVNKAGVNEAGANEAGMNKAGMNKARARNTRAGNGSASGSDLAEAHPF